MKHKGNPGRAAVQLRLADTSDIDKARQLTYYHKGVVKAKLHLIDLPDILTAGFASHLEKLKELARTHDFAFAAEIAPRAGPTGPQMLEPPPNIEYDVSCLRDPSSKETSMRKSFTSENRDVVIPFLQQHTTLDDGQAVALFDNLSRKMAFTQGPPGTGKTFLGAAECEVILNSQKPDDRKPIVVVCMTNHALDDFIASLLKRKITRIARIGTRSTHEWIGPYLLRAHTKRTRPTCNEQTKSWEARKQMEGLARQGSDWARALTTKPLGWAAIADHLRLHHPKIFTHFAAVQNADPSLMDIRQISHWSGFAFEYWVDGGDILDVDSLIEILEDITGTSSLPDKERSEMTEGRKKFFKEILDNATKAAKRKEFEVWSLDLEERKELLQTWIQEINSQRLCEMMAGIHRRHQEAILRRKEVRQAADKRVVEFQEIDIIGLTSTGCAQHWDLLKSIEPRVILFEESSELIETHSLCALVPSIKHMIQIGDPLQLRPHVEQMALSVEMDGRYQLDVSLFERLMNVLPFSKLHIQRRAHPDLADLLRVGDYDYLEDHPNTRSHPSVPGMVKRFYWLDHKEPEDQPDPRSPLAKSFSNGYEVESIAGFVKFLVERQGYTCNKITVLTPYNGQLAALTKRLGQNCSVHLTKEDREMLEDADILKEAIGADPGKDNVPLTSMIHLATIDNYQGEENDVVILSTVRSQGKLGFMKNRNRINVAISRAHNGFYVFGNTSLMMGADHWSPIIDVFKKHHALGTSFPVVSCSRHDGCVTSVQMPGGFEEVPYCQHICAEILACGHSCQQLCHPLNMHLDGRVVCQEICGKTLPCGHTCGDACGKRCRPCQQELEAIKLECGHEFVPCCSTNTVEIRCDVEVSEIKLDCGHRKSVKCFQQSFANTCIEKCAYTLPCGHPCPGACSDCSQTGKKHPSCIAACRKLLSCQHECAATCHQGRCPPCRSECKKSCRHGPCPLPCHTVCDPCIKSGDIAGCEHRASDVSLCCFPSLSLPCSEPCAALLPCMLHVCPSLCGETCPRECLECQELPVATKRTITLQCQHTFDVEELDTLFGLTDVYELDTHGAVVAGAVKKIPSREDLVCPTCSSPAVGTRRYELSNRLGQVYETIDRLYAKYGRRMAAWMEETKHVDGLVFGDIDDFCARLKTGPLSVKNNRNQLKYRAMSIDEVQQTAMRYRDEVVRPTQKAIEGLCVMLGSELFPIPVLPFELRFDRIFYHCRLMRIELHLKALAQLRKVEDGSEAMRILINGMHSMVQEECLRILGAVQDRITECEHKSLKRLEVEYRIVQISFALALTVIGTEHHMEISASLERAERVCHAYPKSAGLLRRNLKLLGEAVDAKRFPSKVEDVWDPRTIELWQKWGKHKIGSLIYCYNNHPYSRAEFPNGCPECGPVLRESKVVERPKDSDQDGYKTGLVSAEEFMAYVRSKRQK